MPIIDPDGYFGGDRFDDVSDVARVMWPSFFLASNTVARLELNYFKIIAKAFSRWKQKPTEPEFWSLVNEYHEAFLLFVYRSPDGQLWGQWDTSERFLSRHKLAADLRTPAPLARDFVEWKNRYIERKGAKSNAPANFANIAQFSESFPRDVRGIGSGIGGGIGEGETKTNAPGGAADVVLFALESPEKKKPAKEIKPDPIADWFHRDFWPIYPRKDDKEAALKAARKALPGHKPSEVMTGLRQQLPVFAQRDRDKIPLPSTWLNKKRWNDELGTGPPVTPNAVVSERLAVLDNLPIRR